MTAMKMMSWPPQVACLVQDESIPLTYAKLPAVVTGSLVVDHVTVRPNGFVEVWMISRASDDSMGGVITDMLFSGIDRVTSAHPEQVNGKFDIHRMPRR